MSRSQCELHILFIFFLFFTDDNEDDDDKRKGMEKCFLCREKAREWKRDRDIDCTIILFYFAHIVLCIHK